MGERIFRPGIRTSDKAAANIRDGGWIAQVFYDWLITTVDDYGRYDARPAILRAEVFPLLLDLVREADVSRCLKSCEAAGLIRLYTHDGKPYLELLNFKQRMRAATSRFPAPPGTVTPPHDNGMTEPTDTESELETDTESYSSSGGGESVFDGLPLPPGLDNPRVKESLAEFESYRSGLGKKHRMTVLAAKKVLKQCEGFSPDEVVAAVDQSIASGWTGVFPKRGRSQQQKGNHHANGAKPGADDYSIPQDRPPGARTRAAG